MHLIEVTYAGKAAHEVNVPDCEGCANTLMSDKFLWAMSVDGG